MPYTWTLRLRAAAPREQQVTPAQLHALACTLLEGAAIDHHSQTKPFSVTPLMGAPDAPGCALLALGWLDDSTTPPLDKRLGEQVRLGGQFFTVEDAHVTGAPYAALRTLPPSRRVTMDFLSVTYFTRKGRWIPLPDPELLYAGLARRWNTYAGIPIPDGLITALREAVLLAAHEVRSAPAEIGQGHRIGFLGQASFTLLRTVDTEVLAAFTALSRFAECAGVGAQTTHGLGWTTVTTLERGRGAADKQPSRRDRYRPARRQPVGLDSGASQTGRSQTQKGIM
ncbi:CRISPR system precrRNA processing endoribonuclease RAMP protein Cas6 [Streptomyces sp. DT224]|uniref:CRISPR system precrRNA processing endoribonuclease RAMP protein Cas6 n=1 Tax=Streptomyces sp. DT224 TaxID=3393426 RepID=UPI003CE7B54E